MKKIFEGEPAEGHICPHCKKPVYDNEALMCLYCGESLERPIGTLGRIRYSAHWSVVLCVVLFICLALIILFLK